MYQNVLNTKTWTFAQKADFSKLVLLSKHSIYACLKDWHNRIGNGKR